MTFAVAHRVPRDAAQVQQWVDVGTSRFEADVQLAGETVVVSHFLPFLRLRGWVQHDGTRFRWRGGPPHDLSLAEVVALIPDRVGVLLDPKETAPARRAALTDALAAALPEPRRFVVSTDYDDDLVRYRAAGFRTWRTVKDAGALRAVLERGDVPDAGFSVRHSLLGEQVVARLHDIGGLVVAWTVNDTARAQHLMASGVDGITTDRPDIASLVTGPDRTV